MAGNCRIEYNQDNTINKVLDSQGNESNLFNEIAELPFVDTKEDALEIYLQNQQFETTEIVGPNAETVAENFETTYDKVKNAYSVKIGNTEIIFKDQKNPITNQRTGNIEIDKILTPTEFRGQGSARNAKIKFLEVTDRLGVPTYEMSSPLDKTTTVEGLSKLNRSLGYINPEGLETEWLRKPRNIRFQKTQQNKSQEGLQEVIAQVQKTNLAEEVVQLSNSEMEAKLVELGVNKVKLTTSGFVHKNKVYLNKDKATAETAIHEFHHLYNQYLKENNPELYKKGLDLIATELNKENSEIQSTIEYVERTQPNLKGEAKVEEILTQLLGEKGIELINDTKTSSIKDWLKDVWSQIKDMLGLSDYSLEEVLGMDLNEYAKVRNVDLLRGNEIFDGRITVKQAVERNNGNTLNLAPNGKPSILYKSYKDLGYSEVDAETLTAQTFSNNFITWFSGSKVVDENNQPLLVFHGSDNLKNINIFQSNKGYKYSFFTEDRWEAKRYITKNSSMWKDSQGIGSFLIKADSTLDIRKNGISKKLLQFINNNAKQIYKEANEVFSIEKEMYFDDYVWLLDDNTKSEKEIIQEWNKLEKEEKIVKILKRGSNDWKLLETTIMQGYLQANFDSFITNESEGINIAVFNPNQIKSATENIGAFSSESNDIRYQKTTGNRLSYKAGEITTNSYREALEQNSDIEVGIETNEGFKTVATVPNNTNPNTKEGFINSYVRDGIIKERKLSYKGKTYLVPAGLDIAEQYINKLILQDDLGIYLGRGAYEQKEGLFNIIGKPTLKNLSEQYKKVTKGLTEEVVRESDIEIEEKPKLNENSLKLKLLNILNKLGVETLSISNYISKFKDRFGVEPSAIALADIANRVVAFKNGDISIEDLTEEVMHFIVEALPAEVTENLRRNIHRTAEYQEFSEHYREIYTRENPNKNKEEIEHMVRQEVLGKLFKNATLSKLNKENTTKNFYDRAIDAIRDFFNRIIGVKNYESELSQINDLVEELIIQDSLEIISKDNIDADYRLYNSQSSFNDRDLDTLRVLNKDLSASLEKSLNNLKRAGTNVANDVQQIRSLRARLETATQAEAVLSQITAAHNIIKFVKKGIEVAKGKGKMLGLKERQAFQEMTLTALPLISAIRESVLNKKPNDLGISKEENQKEVKEKLVNKLDELILEVSTVVGKEGIVRGEVFEEVVDRMMNRFDLPVSYRAIVEKQLVDMDSELSVFMHLFGQMNNTSDILLNISSSLIEEMYSNQKDEEQEVLRNFTNKLQELGITPKQMKQLVKGGYLLSKWDFEAFEQAKIKIEFDERQKYFPKETIEEYTEARKRNSFEVVPEENQDDYWGEVQSKMNEIIEKPNNIKHYTDKAEKFKKLKISIETIKFLNSISADRGSLYNKAIDENGKIHLTDEDVAVMNALSHQRKVAKDIFNEAGNLKAGISETKDRPSILPEGTLTEREGIYYDLDNDVNVVKKNGIYYTLEEEASVEAKKAFDLYRFDQSFIEEKKDDADSFQVNKKDLFANITRLYNEQGADAAIDFIKNNIGIAFTSTFWDSLSADEGTLKKYEDDSIYGDTVYEIRKYQNRLSTLKKRQQDAQNPSEVNGHEMLKSHREEIKLLTEKIAAAYSTLPKEEFKAQSGEVLKETNNAYTQHLIEKEIKKGSLEEYDVIKENVTSKNADTISKERNEAKSFDKGNFFRGSKALRERLDKIKEGTNLTYEEAYLEIARTKLLSYFRRTTPKNYQSLKEIISEGRKNNESSDVIYTDLVNQLTEIRDNSNFDLNVNFSYNKKQNDETKNKNYESNFIGGIYQPQLDKFANKGYINMFAPDSEGDATKNKELFEALQTVTKFKKEAHDRMEVSNTENVYKAPQISRTTTDKLFQLFRDNKGKKLKEIIKDTFQFRVDDLEYGVTNSVGQMAIPKLYVRDLENKEDVSDDLYFTMLQFMSQSTLYKARKNAVSDLHAVEEKISERSVGGKKEESSHNYKLFKSNLEYHIFGVKEQKKQIVDLSAIGMGKLDIVPIIRKIHKLVRFRNLAQNITIPLTSLITAKVNWFIEGKINEYVSSESMRMASSEFKKLAPETMKNSMEYDDKSKLNLLGEFVELYDMTDRARNAKYGKGIRMLGKASMINHSMGNFPIIPKLMLATMMDFRIVNGRMVNRTVFYKQAKREGQKTKEIDILWSKYKEDNLYNFLEIKDNKIQVSEKLYSKHPTVTQEDIQETLKAMRFAVKDRQQKIDGQIPESQKLAAQRHYLLTFLTTHMGWLYIAGQRRFKGLNTNHENGQLEMGTYTAAGKLLMNTFGELGNHNKNIVKAYRAAKKNPKMISAEKSLGFDVSIEDFKSVAGELPKTTLNKIKEGFDLYETQKDVEFQIDKLIYENKLTEEKGKALKDKMNKLVQTEDFKDEAVNLISRTEKRIQVEVAVMLAVGAIAYAIGMAADDEEFKRSSPIIAKILGSSAYILERTANETRSGTIGVPGEIYDKVTGTEIVGKRYITELTGIFSKGFSGKEIERGNYKGYSESYKYWSRAIPVFNEYFKYKHIDKTRSTFKYYNSTEFQRALDFMVEGKD